MKAKSETKTSVNSPATPLDALLQASQPWMPVPAQFVESWQKQMNAGLRVMDAMLAGAVKTRDAQLPAAGEFMARAAELQKSMLAARTPLDLWTVQCNWMMESATRGMALCKDLIDAASEANAAVCNCLREEAQQAGGNVCAIGQAAVNAPGGSVATQDLVKTALVTIDAAYGQMLKGSQQMMAAATEALNAGARFAAPAAKPGAKRGTS
ncbi:MAG: hypothetical protein EPO27_03055 [Betaproteobacteria bacterium]|nr:MAG: hypothetical protein EPO27_03055 [Betaproteobacteria bacterium]